MKHRILLCLGAMFIAAGVYGCDGSSVGGDLFDAGEGGNGGSGGGGDCTPATEACDGIDNDCDGIVDNDVPGVGDACNTGLSGTCADGTQVCNGTMMTCKPNASSDPELCNGIDDNCNGQVDDATTDTGKACSTGEQGVCDMGITTCSNGAEVCISTQMPSTETCNSLDDDCNGKVDDLALCTCTAKTFNGREYLFCTGTLSWTDALAACQASGYSLVSIASAEENTFVHDTAASLDNVVWWLGLNDTATEGTFVWSDGSPLSYSNWAPGEPNNYNNNEDCVTTNRPAGSNLWNDEPCTQSFPYVCKKP